LVEQVIAFSQKTLSSQELLPGDALVHSHMRAKSRVSLWLRAAAILAVAECLGVADATAQSSGDLFRFNASSPVQQI
jgi:hypothetical protein